MKNRQAYARLIAEMLSPDYHQSSDAQLVASHLAGESDAFAALVKRYLKPAYNFARRFVADQAETEDVTQEIFIKLWKNLKRYDQSRPFKPWFFTLARNVALDHLKQRFSLPFSHLPGAEDSIADTIIDPLPLPEEWLVRRDRAEAVAAALAALSPLAQTVVTLHETEELTFEEIAAVLAEPLNTVKSRYRRALLALHQKLDLNRI